MWGGRTRRRKFSAAAVGTAVAVACAPGQALGDAVGSQWTEELYVGRCGDVLRLDPQTSSQTVDLQTFDNLFDTLVWRTPANALAPRAALEWRMINDTTWQFKLRPNVKWHNGDPFTADDVKFTFERAIDPKGPSIRQTAFPLLSRVDVVDPLTVNFIMKSPDGLWPARLNGMGAWLASEVLRRAGPGEFREEADRDGTVQIRRAREERPHHPRAQCRVLGRTLERREHPHQGDP